MGRLVAFAAWLLLSVPVASAQEAGPFGLRMGMQVEDIGTPDANPAPGIYSFYTVPKPEPDVAFYYALVGSTTGLCKIMAMGNPVRSHDGTEFKAAFSNARDAMYRSKHWA